MRTEEGTARAETDDGETPGGTSAAVRPRGRAALRAYSTLMWAVLAGLVVAGATAALVRNEDSEYVSTAVLQIDQPGLFRTESEGLIVKLSRLRVRYRDLMMTETIITPAARRLKVRGGVVRSALTVSVPRDALTLFVTAKTEDPELSKRIAQTVAAEVGRQAEAEQKAAKVPANDQVALKVIDKADTTSRIQPSLTRALVTAVLAGALAFGAVYLALLVVAGLRSRSG